MQISKSDYMLFLRHPAWMWLRKNDPKKLPLVEESTQALFDAGNQFEPYAESQFPEGATLGFSDYGEYLSLPQRTQGAIKNGTQVLFQPRFEWQDFTCICDIVSFVGDNAVDLYEIKASTSAKVEHEFDLAFQTAVLEGTGLKVRNSYVIHVNNTYVRSGPIEADKITHTEDITDKVRKRSAATSKYMPLALATAQQTTMPDPSPELAKLGSKKAWLQVYKAIVLQTPKQYPADTAPTIQHDEIKNFLDGLKYPLYFLDYETMSGLIPYFDGHRPYQQVPFQYSLHLLREPGAELRQKEYLHRENSDPSLPIVQHLVEDIGTRGSIITWNASFEKSCNVTLGQLNPEFRDAMTAINERIVDLMIPFKPKNAWYGDVRFEGSASIKKVLPVVVPALSYKDLDIQNGGSAQSLWMQAVLDGTRDDKNKILDDLIKYCSLDTLAMVEIYNVLRKL